MGLKERCSAQLSGSSQGGKQLLLCNDEGSPLTFETYFSFYTKQVIKYQQKLQQIISIILSHILFLMEDVRFSFDNCENLECIN